MVLGVYAKAIVALLISIAIVVVQAVSGVYANGITGVEWLGIAATVLGPAGLVAAFANTPFSPATKAIVQHVCMVALVVIQGVIHIYGHITVLGWLGIAATLLSTLAVYFVPNSGAAVRSSQGTTVRRA